MNKGEGRNRNRFAITVMENEKKEKLTLPKMLNNLVRNDPHAASWVIALLVGAVTFPVLLCGLCLTTGDLMGSVRSDEHMTALVALSAVVSSLVMPAVAGRARVEKYMGKARKEAQPAPVQKAAPKKPAGRPEQAKPKEQKPAQKQEDAATIHIQTPQGETTTFADIAGYAETKKNMEFIVRCLQHPEQLQAVGGKPPNGILLYGPPGTGKTLMAKAIAGTAGVRFFSANATEFVNVWVGQGAQNVRALYQEAKQNAPSIVFIDEIDAIGSTRTAGQNQEYRQTLNALLMEIDGMDKDSGVLTIAATNVFEDLDPALVRPGRFDRKIAIPLPNCADRLAIIRLYAKKRRLMGDISLEKLAKDTVGMSGSAISTLFNEASIRAVMAGRAIITRKDLDDAMTQMLTNGETNRAVRKEDLKVVAYHEAGHAILARLAADDPVQKVSIIGNTSGALGLTIRGGDDRQMLPVEALRGRAIMCYGGRAAEELTFGKDHITTGASQDLKDASRYIRAYLDAGAGSTLLNESSFAGRHITPDTSEAKELSVSLYAEAVNILSEHQDILERVASALLDKETLMEEELEKLLKNL